MLDNRDAKPLKVYNQKFYNIDSISSIPASDIVENALEIANNGYNSMPLWEKILYNNAIKNIYLAALSTSKGGEIIMDMPHAATFLAEFLSNSGQNYEYDATQIIEETACGEEKFKENLDIVFSLCEETVVEQLFFETNSKSKFAATNFSSHGSTTGNNIELDWQFALGDSDATMSFDCIKENQTYKLNINYYINDCYDWEENSKKRGGLVSDGDMYLLHKGGWARSYKSIGKYSVYVEWYEGDRFNEKNQILIKKT